MSIPAAEKTQPPVHRRYRFTFCKTGDARFLSHRQLMDTLERVVRATGIPVRYTEGFNPHIRLSMGPALAVGHQGEAEIFDVDCTAPVREHHVQQANDLLPEGVVIHDVKALLPGAPSLGKLVAAARYRVDAGKDQSPWPGSADEIEEELRAGVLDWRPHEEGRLDVELNVRQEDGPTLSLKQLLIGLGFDEKRAARLRVTRKMLILRPRHKDRKKDSTKIPGEAAV